MKVNVGGSWKDTKPHVNVGGTWKPASVGWVNINGTWKKFYTSERNVRITANTVNYNLYKAIGIPDEDVINVYIDKGVIVYASTTGVPAFNIGNAYTGKTINIINEGTIRGQGGAGSSTGTGGAGGTALYVRTANKVNITNKGAIYGGGGGGGRGGNGGPGYYTTSSKRTVREPSSGYYRRTRNPIWEAAYAGRRYSYWWNGKQVGRSGAKTITTGGWTYRVGPGSQGASYHRAYDIYRTKVVTDTTRHNTNGGAGGKGGNGWPRHSGGSGGAAGGKNAGRGGTGGTGGGAGLAGAKGSTGARGNRGGGAGGSNGGRAGYSIDGNSKVILKAAGDIRGNRVN